MKNHTLPTQQVLRVCDIPGVDQDEHRYAHKPQKIKL